MIPLLVPIGLGLIGGYLTKESHEMFCCGGSVPAYAKGGSIESLEKELRRLQRELNSHRLSTYMEGDTSEEEMARTREREAKLARFNEILKLLREHDSKKFAKGGGVGETTQVYGKYKNNNTDEPYIFSSNSKGLDFLTNHNNIDVLSVGQGKYDLFYGWDKNKQEDGTLYFGKWNKGNFGFTFSGVIKYAKGGGVKQDLFETPEKMPKKVSSIIDRYWEEKGDDMDYEDTENMLKEVEAVGYTFDYGLDNTPMNLRPIKD